MDNDLELKSKFSNIFIMLVLAIQTDDLDNVKHFLTDELYNKYKEMADGDRARGEMHCFDEANVKAINITKRTTEGEYEVVEVSLTSRYMNYYINLETGKTVRGIDYCREELSHTLVFKKRSDAVKGAVVKCEGCGANLDVNFTGKCEYCGTIHSAEKYDYILTSITNL